MGDGEPSRVLVPDSVDCYGPGPPFLLRDQGGEFCERGTEDNHNRSGRDPTFKGLQGQGLQGGHVWEKRRVK